MHVTLGDNRPYNFTRLEASSCRRKRGEVDQIPVIEILRPSRLQEAAVHMTRAILIDESIDYIDQLLLENRIVCFRAMGPACTTREMAKMESVRTPRNRMFLPSTFLLPRTTGAHKPPMRMQCMIVASMAGYRGESKEEFGY